MKYCIIALILAMPCVLHGDEKGESSSQGGISWQEYSTLVLKEENQKRWYPDLSYPGVMGVEWGASDDGLQVLSTAAAPFFDGHGKMVRSSVKEANSFRWRYAPKGGTSRSDMLKHFLRQYVVLCEKYGAPTSSIQPLGTTAAGVDNYLAALVDGYDVAWIGSETKIHLSLSDTSLWISLSDSNDHR